MNDKKISVIIPAYNEETTIVKTLEETIKVLNDYKDLNYEIIIVNDGSSDNTYNLAKNFSKKVENKIKIANYYPNLIFNRLYFKKSYT